jgi:hypothetical protein
LASFLRQHPDVCLPAQKEAHFFDDFSTSQYHSGQTRQEIEALYQRYYPHYAKERIVADATPVYMYFPWVAERVQAYNPQMKWILLLRDPVARALSHYHMEWGRCQECLPAWRAFLTERWRIRPDPSDFHESWRRYSYLDRGRYSRQIAHILKYFPPGQLLLITTGGLWFEHERTLCKVYGFLGLETPGRIPVRERVFAGSADGQSHAGLRSLLRHYYAIERWRLRRLLMSLDVDVTAFLKERLI